MRIDKGSWGNWIIDGWDMPEVKVSAHDREILRSLAKEFRELCERPVEQEKIRLWTAHNDLQQTRPLLLVDMENGWNEAIRFDRDIRCEGTMAQDWEMWLRKEIMYGTQIKDDKPLTPVFYLPYYGVNTEWGISEDHEGSGDINQAYSWKPKLADLDDDEFDELDLDTVIEDPYVKVDVETSKAACELAKEVFDGILAVEFRTWWFWSSHIALAYSHLRGLDGMMIDFYDHPDKVHEIFQRLTTGYIEKLKYLEESGYLYNNVGNTFVGSGGLGFTNQLHPDPQNMRLRDMWGLCESQEATSISPAMYHEFIYPYHKQVSELFGLTCYACCEPADPYWKDVKTLTNLRRVSVSQWANAEKMSEFLGRDYVYSYKACSSDVAVPDMDETHIRKTLRHTLGHTQNNNLEIVLKDLHTIGNKPQQVFRWVEIAREEIARIYG
ncbi:MAG TPA: hypothetical protein VM577_20250 [Anaerovoracaceae bacterium]|nr:hypothetical protein [Anaerovoracaceae bacterium]